MPRRRLVVLACLLALTACLNPCRNTATQEVPAPSGNLHAVLFTRSCGAMTSRAGVGVSLLPRGERQVRHSDTGNIYLNDNRRSDGAKAPTDVQVAWQSDTVLVIRHHADAHVVFAAHKLGPVTVSYETLP